MVAIYKTWSTLYRQPDYDQARDWRSFEMKLSSMTVASGFGHKVTEALAADPRSICYYEILNETKQ